MEHASWDDTVGPGGPTGAPEETVAATVAPLSGAPHSGPPHGGPPDLVALGVPRETLAAGDGRETLARSEGSLVDATLASTTFRDLPRLDESGGRVVELGPIIGAGAMGVVRSAEQPSLRRRVAVKELREGAAPDLVAALVREAWIAGGLDHPNVVPIHALCRGERSPLLVMKRIEGTAWSDVLNDPGLARRFGVEDRIEWHLEILSQLCRAVHFAHSRGILHLDLKPENVMLGEFGEVYLLDWGVAASAREDAPAWLPRAADIRRVCGTPAFLAPEMAAGDGPRFSERTDVYLLGGILHEIVTGRPRHDGRTLEECLLLAWQSEPVVYPAEVPAGLAAICNRATARDPADRYPDVESFRRALHDFLAHRSSAQLVDAALERLAEVRRLVADEAAGGSEGEITLQRRATECRFGLEQARAAWPDNPAIPEALQSLLELQLEHAIRLRRDDAAAALLADLPRPAPALAARVAALREERRADETRRAALERLHRDTDPNVHRRARAALVLGLSLLWGLWSVIAGHLIREGTLTFEWSTHLKVAGGFATAIGLGALVFRKTLLRTQLNRRVFQNLVALFLSAGILMVLAMRVGMEPQQARTLVFAVLVYFVLATAFSVDRRLVVPGVGILVVIGVPTVVYPQYSLELQGLFGVLLGIVAVWLWGRREPAAAERTGSGDGSGGGPESAQRA